MSWLDTFEEIRSTDWSQATEAEREAKASEVVTITAYAGATAAVVPLPFVDLALLLPFHSAMVMTVGHIYGRPVTKTEAKRVVLELGAVAGVTMAGRAAITALKKLLLPGLGGVLAAPASFAVTWGFGRLSIAYFQNPQLSKDELRKVFSSAVSEASGIFSKETFERFRRETKDAPPPGPEPSGEPEDAERHAPTAEPTGEEAPSRKETLRPKKRSL